jgi:hypothetical protein
MQPRDAASRYPVTAWTLGLGLALFAFFVVMHGVNKVVFDDGYVFSLDHDQSIPSWATSALFLLAGAISGLLAWLRPRDRTILGALAAIATGLSIEQVVQLHSRVEEEIADPGAFLIEATIGLAVILVVVLVARTLARPHRYLMLGSIGALLLAALASQANQAGDLPQAGVVFFQTVEEISEMLTALLIIAAVVEPTLRAFERRIRGAASP